MDFNLVSRNWKTQPQGYLVLMKRKGFNESRVMRKLDEEVRNALIVNSWELLTAFTKIERKDKIQYLMETYYLSYSRIEDIITLDKDTE